MRTHVGDLDDLIEERLLADLPSGDQVLVLRDRGRVYAVAALCPHQFAPLIGGEVEEGVLVCPMHGWRFALADGCDPGNPSLCLDTWPVEVIDGQIWIEHGA
jgi:nitrite reductase/ring-hydroxylating ferredoxin subunit